MKKMEFTFALNAMMQGNIITTTKEAYNVMSNMQNVIKNLDGQYKAYAASLGAAKSETQKYQLAMNQLRVQYKAGGMDASVYNSKLREMQMQFEIASNKAERLQQKMAKVSAESKQYQAKQAISDARGKYNASFQNALASYATFQGVKQVASATMSPLINAVHVAADYESAMSKVQAITGSNTAEMQKLNATAQKLGATTMFSAKQSAEAMAYLGMAGWKTEQIMAGMPGLLALAAASGSDLATVADIVSDDLTAFGMSADKAGHMADVMAAASTNANTNVEMMGQTFKYAASVAGSLGYSLEDVAVATGLMANAGIKGEQAGTSLRAVMTRLASPPKAAADAMNQLGISITNADGSMKPLMQVMEECRGKFAGMNEEQKAQMASAIAGQEAMSGWLAIMNASQEDFDKLSGAINNCDGAAQKTADTMQNNAQGAAIKLNSAIESINISVGSVFLPIIADATSKLAEIAGAMGAWAAEHPNLTKVIGGTVVALSALAVGIAGIGLAGAAIQTAITGFVFMKASVAGLDLATKAAAITTKAMAAAQAVLNAVMTANPIGLVIAGIAALIAAGYMLIYHFEEVQAFMAGLWESPIVAVLAFISGPIGLLIYAATGIISNWESVKAWFTLLWDSPTAALEQFYNFFVGKLQDLWNKAKEYGGAIAGFFGFGGGGGAGQDVSHNAYGGIYRQGAFLTTFAENSPEAAIPLDGSPRAISLWQQAGQMLGMIPESLEPSPAMRALSAADSISSGSVVNNSSSANQNISISVPVTINGTADTNAISSMQANIESAVRRALADIRNQERRVSFA